MSPRTIRIGSGAGFSGDRIEPAVALAESGQIDYLAFECLAERTIALAVAAKLADPQAGYDPHLEERLAAVLPGARRNGVRIISNMGAANPVAAARAAARIAGELGLGPLRIAAVVGDDVLAALDDTALPAGVISANAYLGCEPIVEALAQGADIVLTGRVADPSLFLAPLVHEFGWALDDWPRLGRGTVVGHLLECAGQITGGYFADPGVKDVPGLADLGFPIAEVDADGAAVIGKLDGSGGRVSVAACTEQLLYELHDPQNYLTPDVAADFSTVRFEATAEDRVRVMGGGGGPRPGRLKVSIGHHEGFLGEGQISYAGPGAVARARLALSIVSERLLRLGDEVAELRQELIGLDSLCAAGRPANEPPREVRARIAARTRSLAAAERVGREVEALYTNGPAGGGGVSRSAKPIVAIDSAFIDRAAAVTRLHWEAAP
jgi:hypothetical protein